MAFFSKTIPERKWPSATSGIAIALKQFSNQWLVNFQKSAVPHGSNISALNALQQGYINLVQIGSVSATLAEFKYLRNLTDLMFFNEAVYIALTGNSPQKLHADIEALPFALAGEIDRSMPIWAQLMADEFGFPQHGTLIEELRKYGLFTVLHARIVTCDAAGDRKAADRIRAQVL